MTVNIDEENRGKTMTSDIAIRDDMKAVERWENEGGRVPLSNRVWTSLKRSVTERTSRESAEIFRSSTFGGWSSETKFQTALS